VPALLPEVPRDRFDGQEIKYVLRGSGPEAHPILYSIGTDRIDDGGLGPAEPGRDLEVMRYRTPAEVKAWLAAGANHFRGDWILYDPAGVAGRLSKPPPPPAMTPSPVPSPQ
jgi:hypothetical protein